MICKYCKEEIADGAVKCKHCGSALKETEPVRETILNSEYYCSSCGASIRKEAQICPKCGVRNKTYTGTSKKNKVTAGVLAIFLGFIGIHKFYLGKTGQGIIYLLLFWTLIPAIVAFIEGIIYLTSSDENFDLKYNN